MPLATAPQQEGARHGSRNDDDEASLREWDRSPAFDAFGLNPPASAISSRAKGTAAHCQPAERRPASTS